jgi:predicted ATPase
LCVDEGGGAHRKTPTTRLSDGTLRYLCLLALLLHPEPPPLIVIEEPELGLHSDVLPHLAELLTAAAERMQLVVTTHSRMLVDAFSGQPESIIVCGKENGESRMERLSAGDLKEWLAKYSLGDLWSKGEIGGNRW